MVVQLERHCILPVTCLLRTRACHAGTFGRTAYGRTVGRGVDDLRPDARIRSGGRGSECHDRLGLMHSTKGGGGRFFFFQVYVCTPLYLLISLWLLPVHGDANPVWLRRVLEWSLPVCTFPGMAKQHVSSEKARQKFWFISIVLQVLLALHVQLSFYLCFFFQNGDPLRCLEVFEAGEGERCLCHFESKFWATEVASTEIDCSTSQWHGSVFLLPIQSASLIVLS